MTKEWIQKNVSGILVSCFAAIVVYALGSYISNSITREMKSYVPIGIWNTWAQERGEWRGQVDQRLKNLESEMNKQREEILKELRENGKLVAVQTQMIQDLKDQFKQHINKNTVMP
jgi:IMP dehydrogenase/GMP reductase